MNIILTIPQLVELLTYHNTFDSVSLVNHEWLADILKEQYTVKELFRAGLYLQNCEAYFVLWTSNGWIAELQRQRDINKILSRNKINLEVVRQSIYKLCFKRKLLDEALKALYMDINVAEKILAKSTDELEKLSDAELIEYLKPCFQYTRPESALPVEQKPKKTSTPKAPREKKLSPMAELAQLLKGHKLPEGIKL